MALVDPWGFPPDGGGGVLLGPSTGWLVARPDRDAVFIDHRAETATSRPRGLSPRLAASGSLGHILNPVRSTLVGRPGRSPVTGPAVLMPLGVEDAETEVTRALDARRVKPPGN